MKYQVGDLFLTGNHITILLTKIEPCGLMHGYMSDYHIDMPADIAFAWLFNIELHIERDGWKHYSVRI